MTRIHSENEGLNPKQPPALRAKTVSGSHCVQSEMQAYPCTFRGQEEMLNTRTQWGAAPMSSRDARAVGRVPCRRPPFVAFNGRPSRPAWSCAHEGFRRAIDTGIWIFDVAAGEPGPRKCKRIAVRRTSNFRGRNFRSAAVLAVAQNPARATAGAARPCQPGCSCRARRFRNALRCSVAARHPGRRRRPRRCNGRIVLS
jgi:hypothetical protein